MSGDRDAMDQLCRLLRRATREGWAGLALHAGRMDAYELEAGLQLANGFYRQLAQAGGGD